MVERHTAADRVEGLRTADPAVEEAGHSPAEVVDRLVVVLRPVKHLCQHVYFLQITDALNKEHEHSHSLRVVPVADTRPAGHKAAAARGTVQDAAVARKVTVLGCTD